MFTNEIKVMVSSFLSYAMILSLMMSSSSFCLFLLKRSPMEQDSNLRKLHIKMDQVFTTSSACYDTFFFS